MRISFSQLLNRPCFKFQSIPLALRRIFKADVRMPRKRLPKYGTELVQEMPTFAFKNAEVEQLFNSISPVNRDRPEILRQLNNIARDYVWLRDQNQKKPTRAQQSAALDEIGKFAHYHSVGLHRLANKLRGLDMDTEWKLLLNLPADRTKTGTAAIADLADRLEDVALAAKHALQTGKKGTGPRVPVWVHRTVVRLANLYDWVTGEAISHNPKVKTIYDGHPHSRGGSFIVAFFAIVDPQVTPISLGTVLASVVKIRRRDRRLTST